MICCDMRWSLYVFRTCAWVYRSAFVCSSMAIGTEHRTTALVLECVQCRHVFLSAADRDSHEMQTCHRVKERYQCWKCDKHFGNQQILKLHLRVHESGQQVVQSTIGTDIDTNEDAGTTIKPVLSDAQTTMKKVLSSLPVKKSVGLTKIRLEDCLRCDACSCIYIDKNDYNKHMKNFHRQNSAKKHKQRKGCKACCKHCNCQGNHQNQSVHKDRGNNNLFHYNIKDRWTKMVSRRLSCSGIKREIKSEPDNDPLQRTVTVDYSHLLSQVEVKIKTEPPDESEFAGQSLVQE